MPRSVIDAIGNTPLIRLNKASEQTGCEILGKAEFMNPGQSVKDRAGLFIIRDAEQRGLLKPGGVIVEGTAGNTGIGLTLVAKALGYRTVIVIPDTQSQEKKDTNKLLGADYQTLVDVVNLSADEKDLDGLNAHVTSYWVRGIATTNAAIVMRRGTDLWIGLLVFDAKNNVRMRYYSNVPAWKKTVPKTINAWHDNLDKTLPIDVMQ